MMKSRMQRNSQVRRKRLSTWILGAKTFKQVLEGSEIFAFYMNASKNIFHEKNILRSASAVIAARHTLRLALEG